MFCGLTRYETFFSHMEMIYRQSPASCLFQHANWLNKHI